MKGGKRWWIAVIGSAAALILGTDAWTQPALRRDAPSLAKRSAEHSAGRQFRDCADCPEMVVVPAGSFTMGSPDDEVGRNKDEGPRRRITIPHNFAVGRLEVTRGQYAAFTRATGREVFNNCYTDRDDDGHWVKDPNGNWRDPGFAQDDDQPVACVNWEDAQAYVAWLNSRAPGGGYRLLSEAEWEFAARAGADTLYPWGAGASRDQANYGTSEGHGAVAGRDRWLHTAPGGSFPANAFGLSDMIGNVWEWTEDCYEDSLTSVPADGRAYEDGKCSHRVYRGGSWNSPPQYARSVFRTGVGYTPLLRGDDLGFRVAKSLEF